MPTPKTWLVRAGQAARNIDHFTEHNQVAIGWPDLGPIPGGASREDVAARVTTAWPNYSRSKTAAIAGQIYRFLTEIQVGDHVLTYDQGQRVYHLGTIAGEPAFNPDQEGMQRWRPVRWQAQIQRDDISQRTRNSLGAISTLFLLPEDAAAEMHALASGATPQTPAEAVDTDSTNILDDVRNQSRELIKDRITRLDWEELQELVAGVLRAMGYKTRVSPPGADRGIDVLASPDGFGFEQPRIIVECKHRPRSPMGSQDIRTFLGGRHKDDKGLYVSTGGFTKDARYEAERASIPTTLMDLDQLVDAVLEHYEGLDSESRALMPLTRVYWPIEG